MKKLGLLVTAIFLAVSAVTVGASSVKLLTATRLAAASPLAGTISIQELHRQADLTSLPVSEIVSP